MTSPGLKTSLSRAVACALALAAVVVISAPARQAPAACRSGADSDRPVRKVLFVVIDRVGIDDWADAATDLPNLRSLISRGAVGLMNAKAWSGPYGFDNYLIIGAGGRARGAENAGLAFDEAERVGAASVDAPAAGALFEDITGVAPPGGSVVNLAIEQINAASSGIESTSTAGRLGQSLVEAGRETYVCGNSDYELSFPGFDAGGTGVNPVGVADSRGPGRVFQRQVSCIAMDERGITPGDVSTRRPPPAMDDTGGTAYLAELVPTALDGLARSEFVVVETGETSRVEQLAGWLPEDMLEARRREALERCDGALGDLLAGVDLEKDLVVVCAPTPTGAMVEKNDLFTPLLVAGPGFAPGSLLYSPSTRRPGLVTNFDVAPTVLDSLHAAIPEMMEGAPAGSVPAGGRDRLAELEALRDRVVFYSSLRHVFLDLFVYLLIALLIGITVLLIVSPSAVANHLMFWLSCLFCFLWAPVVFVVTAIGGARSATGLALLVVALDLVLGFGTAFAALLLGGRRRETALTSGGAGRWRYVPAATAIVLASSVIAVGLDPLLGSPMMPFSPFGSTLAGAGRYYGIGNVYSGIILGAAIVLACLAPDVLQRWIRSRGKVTIAAVCIILPALFFLGSSRLGANVGGLMAGLAGGFATIYRLRREDGRLKRLAVTAALFAAFLVIFLLSEALIPGPASHGTRLVSRVQAGGFNQFWSLAARKLALDWELLWTSVWRLLFLTSIILGLAWFRRPPVFGTVCGRHRFMGAALAGLIVTMVAGIAFNDTGIETAGAVSIYLLLPAILLYLPGERM
ncbi:MAG: hypothetical protein V1748_09665 [Actinomycetota bacterium]